MKSFFLPVLFFFIVLLSCRCNNGADWGRFFTFPADRSDGVQEIDIKPWWSGVPSPRIALEPANPEHFELLVDRSVPMRGYFDSSQDTSLFPDVFLNLYYNMVRQYGGRGVNGKCYGVTNTITEFECGEKLKANFFSGGESQINVALDGVVDRIRLGQISGAALISDLLVTPADGSPPSPMGLLQNRRTVSVLLSALDSGDIELGLLGLRLKYWGVQDRCGDTGLLGCWFDEGSQQWMPLDAPAQRPLYALIIGIKQAENSISMDGMVTRFIQTLGEIQGGNQIATEHELFTAVPGDSEIKWEVIERHHALRYNSGMKRYKCFPSGNQTDFQLAGKYRGGALKVSEVEVPASGPANWITSQLDTPDSFLVLVDCEIVKQHTEDAQTLLRSEPKFTLHRAHTDLWQGWSCPQYASGCTFGLDGLLEQLRPTSYEGKIDPFIMLDNS